MSRLDQRVREFLDGKSYLVPAVAPQLLNVCPRCRGPHPKPQYAVCSRCNNFRNLFDKLGFCIYATVSEHSNSGRVMYSYKGSHPSRESQLIVTSLLYEAFSRYIDQIPYTIDVVTIVPSISTNRTGTHALLDCTRNALRHAGIDIEVSDGLRAASDTLVSRDDVRPSHYRWTGDDPLGRNALLVEDAWVKGNHMQNAGQALRDAGFGGLSGLCVARWMTPGYQNCSEIFSAADREHSARDKADYPLNPFSRDGSGHQALLG